MCGIFCSLSRTSHIQPDDHVSTRLKRRGPDSTGCVQHAFRNRHEEPSSTDVFLNFTSTVLSLRGSNTVSQPIQHPDGSHVLCWNGEAWSVAGKPTEGNDTQAIFTLLSGAAAASHKSNLNSEDAALEMAKHLASVAGPYAFVFYDNNAGRLYLGRDLLGRRSLLWRVEDSGDLLISSVTSGSMNGSWTEVEADGIYCIDLTAAPGKTSPDHAVEQSNSFAVLKVPYHVGGGQSSHDTTSVGDQKHPSERRELMLSQDSPSVLRLEQLLRGSLAHRVLNIPDPPNASDLPQDVEGRQPTRLAVLFSGGLDCTVLARLTHALLPTSEPIDLLNVAFQNPRIHKAANDDPELFAAALESCPDRITGRASYAELCEICPGRQWRFVAINVPYTETVEHQEEVITLMHPHNTEMDLSIACALYFAARGKGLMSPAPEAEPELYTTSARVLLSGLGADELFAGYTRHATAYNRHGFQGLIDELNLDIGRLGKRNLGRDDRVITNWGKEARFPFLDEALVAWALAAHVSDKCDFGAPIDEVDDPSSQLESCKKVLRCLAWRLGMCKVASEKKRAIQFGARTAKMATGKTKGTTPLS